MILPAGSLESATWHSLGDALWTTIGETLGAKRVARQGSILPNGIRSSGLKLLLGRDAYVEHLENGIRYTLDAQKCMFSKGNGTEKLRVAAFPCEGETVLDLFAGIGYYTLPYLVKAKAKKVFACEWNPFAVTALRNNLKVNGVEDRCSVLEGDNRLTAPKAVAHRVNLGLLPSSEVSWQVAVEALRQEGGMLHVHGNVVDSDELEWAERTRKCFELLALEAGRSWKVEVVHVERVKWYAPHIRHLVADIHCHDVT